MLASHAGSPVYGCSVPVSHTICKAGAVQGFEYGGLEHGNAGCMMRQLHHFCSLQRMGTVWAQGGLLRTVPSALTVSVTAGAVQAVGGSVPLVPACTIQHTDSQRLMGAPICGRKDGSRAGSKINTALPTLNSKQ